MVVRLSKPVAKKVENKNEDQPVKVTDNSDAVAKAIL